MRFDNVISQLVLAVTNPGRIFSGGSFVRKRKEKLLCSSKVFNQSFYESECGRSFRSKRSAVKHYLDEGAARQYSPGPLFDPVYYAENNADVVASNTNLLVHYLRFGDREKRDPHPMFKTGYYQDQEPACQSSKPGALEYFLTYSQGNPDVDPSPVFSLVDYHAINKDAMAVGENALVHYLLRREKLQKYADKKQAQHAGNGPTGEKLILCSHDASRTGAPLIILKIAEALANLYHFDLRIILIRGGPLEPEFLKCGEVINIERLGKGKAGSIGMINVFAASTVDESTRLALCNSAESHLVVSELARHGVRVISLVHEFTESYSEGVIENLQRDSYRIILPARIVLQSLQKKLQKSPTNLEVLPQGIFADRDYTSLAGDDDRRQLARQRLFEADGIPTTAKIVLGSGYIDNRKGCDYFMLTSQLIQATWPELDFAFVWVGQLNASFSDSNFRFWLHNDLQRSDAGEKLFFVGEKPDPTDYFLSADVFFMCSRLDPFPCVVLEAMSAALPVVCFDNTTGSSELLKDGAGTVVPAFQLNLAATAIAGYLTDAERTQKAGDIGQKLIRDQFQYDDYVQALVARLMAIGLEYPPSRPDPVVAATLKANLNSLTCPQVKQPVFIVGATRSGTSILGAILRHLGIPGENEGHVWTLYEKLLKEVIDHDQFIDLAFKGNPAATTYSKIGTTRFISGLRGVFESLTDQVHPEVVWYDKTPSHGLVNAAGTLQEIYPHARFIYIQRNGVENLSSARRKFKQSPFQHLCRHWAKTVSDWHAVKTQLTNVLEIDHRDLVDHPEKAFTELLSFLNLDARLVQILCEFTSQKTPERTSSSYAPVYLSETDWPDTDKQIFLAQCRESMEIGRYSEYLDWGLTGDREHL